MIKITVDGGTFQTHDGIRGGILVAAVVNLIIAKGDNATESDAIYLNVYFDSGAQGVGGETPKLKITSEVKVEILATIVVDLDVALSAGAGGSEINLTSSTASYSVIVKNDTTEAVLVRPLIEGEIVKEIAVESGKTSEAITMEASADKIDVADVKAALEANGGSLIKGDNADLSNVTTALNLYNLSDKYTGVVTGASIEWESDNSALTLGTVDSNGKYPVTITQGSKEVTVILVANIKKNIGFTTAIFTVKIPADESVKPDTTVEVALSTVACTVATGQSITVDGQSVIGSNITLTKPSPTVTVGGTEDKSAKIEISYALSVDKPNDEVFSDTLSLGLPGTDTSKKLWVKVTVTPSEATESTTEYFASEALANLNEGTLSISVSEPK